LIKSAIEFAHESLRYQIIISNLKGGEKLVENEISSLLGISRSPLREAYRILEEEHFVTNVPRKGRYVTEMSVDNYEKVHETRMMLECYVVDILKARKVRELPHVETALKNFCTPPLGEANADEKLRFIESIDEFHIKLVESVNNEFLKHFYGIIRFNITRYNFLYLLEEGAAKYFVQQHHEILNLIKNGQYDKAKDFLRSHMNESWERMRRKLNGEKEI